MVITTFTSGPSPPAGQIPHARVEQSDGHYCGPATAHMIIASRIGSLAPGQAELAGQMLVDGGTNRHALKSALDTYLPRRYAVRTLNEGEPLSELQRQRLFTDFRAGINTGYGAAISVLVKHNGPRPSWFPNPAPQRPIDHWMAVVGYSTADLTILVVDPARWGASGLPVGVQSHRVSLLDIARYTKTYVH